MNLFTASGKKVNAIKLVEPFVNTHMWNPHPFLINTIPMTTLTAPTGKGSQYRFLWGGEWYRIGKSIMEKLPEAEQMVFFTEDPTKPQTAGKKEVKEDGNTFIIIKQFPDIKGLFVGTVLRAFINNDRDAVCNVKGNTVTVNRDHYEIACPIEISTYFSQHFNNLVFVKITKKDPGEMRELVTIIEGVSSSIFARTFKQDKSEEIELSYVYDPTDEQLLQYYIEEATNRQLVPGAFVSYKDKVFEIKSFKLSSRNQLEVIIEHGDKKVSTLLSAVFLVQAVIPTEDGVELARYFVNMIDKKDFLDSLGAQVKESFFRTLKEWSAQHYNEIQDKKEADTPLKSE